MTSGNYFERHCRNYFERHCRIYFERHCRISAITLSGIAAITCFAVKFWRKICNWAWCTLAIGLIKINGGIGCHIQVCTGKETRGRNEEIGGGGGICNAFKGMLVLAVVVRQLAEGWVEAKCFAAKEREKETTETVREGMAGELVPKVSDATMGAWGRLDRGQVLVRSLAINGHCVICIMR